MNNIIAGILGLFLGPVGLWYKGKWAAGFAWLAMGFLTALTGVGLVLMPFFWIGMAIHAFVAAPAAATAPATAPANEATTLSRLLTPNRSTIIAVIIGFLIIRSILSLGKGRVATPPESPPASGASPSTPAATASSPEKFPRAIAVQSPFGTDVPSATPPSATYRVIKISKGDYLNVRAGAGSNYPIVTKLEPGTGDIVLGAKRVANGETIWQEMTVNGQTGWINADYIALETRVSALSSSSQ
jgi:hypothetical protein